jgi:hypothetical protein
MIGRAKAGKGAVLSGRLLLCVAAALAAGGAGWVNPGPGPVPPAGDSNAPMTNAGGPPLVVTAWGLGSNPSSAADRSASPAVLSSRPLYIRLKLEGDAAALDAMRAEGGVPIVVNWIPETANALPAAPALTTHLTVGNAAAASRLAGEVARTGHFIWRTWAEKDTLSPGRWSVSLTYPGGEPLACGAEMRPCRFSFEVG